MAPSRRITSPLIIGFSAMAVTRWANSAGSPRREGKGTCLARKPCTFSGRPASSGVENKPVVWRSDGTMCEGYMTTAVKHIHDVNKICSIQRTPQTEWIKSTLYSLAPTAEYRKKKGHTVVAIPKLHLVQGKKLQAENNRFNHLLDFWINYICNTFPLLLKY